MKPIILGFDISFLALPRPPSTLFLKFLKILTPFAKQVVVKLFQTKFCVDSRTLCPIDMLLKNCFANFLLSIEKAFFLILFPIGTLCLQMNNARKDQVEAQDEQLLLSATLHQ